MKTVYLAYPYDGAEGYNRTLVGGFEQETDAAQIAGENGTVRKVEIYASINEYKAKRENEIRERALNKLTVEERRVLGLE